MTTQYNHGVLFYHKGSGLKAIHEGLGEVVKSLTPLCKHLSIQLSEHEGDIIKYCAQIKTGDYSTDVDILFILGGDGTVNELINGVLQHNLDVPLAIIPGGTFNDFTKTLNLDPRYKIASQQLQNATPQPYDVMKVNDRYALNVQQGNKDVFGKLSYVGSTVKTLVNPEYVNYTLNVDGKKLEDESSMILVANGPFIGGNRIPMTDLSPNDGYLNVFIFDNQKFSVFTDVFKQRDSMNWNNISQGIQHIPAKQITISTDDTHQVDIDGEIALTTPLQIEIIPSAVRILTLTSPTVNTDAN
ncbi:diacylglycerol kinase family protein [Staphylococcus arlettae]